jgi:histidine triad (HIT) family protein
VTAGRGTDVHERDRVLVLVDGVNLQNACGAAAWQTVFHFHVHMIPRYVGDSLRLPWVPTPGDPGEIADTARLLTR